MENIKELKKEFIFLEKLRQSGYTNMYGAVPYVMKEFHMIKEDALEIVANWMETYNKEDYKHIYLSNDDNKHIQYIHHLLNS